jgi:hypothetical protein
MAIEKTITRASTNANNLVFTVFPSFPAWKTRLLQVHHGAGALAF